MPTQTTNYNLNKPNVNSADDEDLWGDQLNDNMDTIDTQLKANADLAAPTTASKTADYTLAASDNNKVLFFDTSGGAITVDGSAATVGDGFKVTFVITDATNAFTFDPDGGETVNGAATVGLDTQYQYITVVSNGTNWFISSDDETTEFASDAEVIAGTEAAKAIAPKFYGDNSDFSSDGYARLPGGLIIQWGLDAEGTVTFPLEFPTACLSVVATLTPVQSRQVTPTVGNFTTTTFTMQIGSDFTENLYWIAVGH